MTSPGSPASARKALLRGREFGDRIHTFSCLSVLHNAVVTWNVLHIGAASLTQTPLGTVKTRIELGVKKLSHALGGLREKVV